jgi:phosphoglycolate phosphatase-like HAD superfamily hydrolase
MEGLVFLDFDGVICDSLLETLVSSWRGYYRLGKKKEPDSMPITLLREFVKLRPYVRAGEDFILIQQLIARKIPIRSQEDFDYQLAQQGAGRIARYKEAFYAARRDFLMKERTYWIGLNRLYPHIVPYLSSWVSSTSLYILSTKRADYIVEILSSKGIKIDPHRVLSCEAKEKNSTILHTLEYRRRERALFIDDQIDHLVSDWARDPRIVGCLASWGYVQQQWLEDPREIEVLHPDQMANRVDSWLED